MDSLGPSEAVRLKHTDGVLLIPDLVNDEAGLLQQPLPLGPSLWLLLRCMRWMWVGKGWGGRRGGEPRVGGGGPFAAASSTGSLPLAPVEIQDSGEGWK